MKTQLKFKTFFCLLTIFALTGCVSREQADERIARGCKAGVETFLTQGFYIKEIKGKTFSYDDSIGKKYRKVTLHTIETDDWLDVPKDYTCIFLEEFGPMQSTYDATIYQIGVGEQTYGSTNGKILGSLENFQKLTEAVEKAMH